MAGGPEQYGTQPEPGDVPGSENAPYGQPGGLRHAGGNSSDHVNGQANFEAGATEGVWGADTVYEPDQSQEPVPIYDTMERARLLGVSTDDLLRVEAIVARAKAARVVVSFGLSGETDQTESTPDSTEPAETPPLAQRRQEGPSDLEIGLREALRISSNPGTQAQIAEALQEVVTERERRAATAQTEPVKAPESDASQSQFKISEIRMRDPAIDMDEAGAGVVSDETPDASYEATAEQATETANFAQAGGLDEFGPVKGTRALERILEGLRHNKWQPASGDDPSKQGKWMTPEEAARREAAEKRLIDPDETAGQ